MFPAQVSESLYTIVCTTFSGTTLLTCFFTWAESILRYLPHYSKTLLAQVIKDAAMAHRVSCLVAAAPPADRFLVVCGVGTQATKLVLE